MQLQSKLRNMEESVMAAQQQSESTLELHDEDARALSPAATPQVTRFHLTVPHPVTPGMKSPISPRITSPLAGKGESLYQASKTAILQKRVDELESALTDADSEMKNVVHTIESSQEEIAELQGEREDASKQMRALQAEIQAEKSRAAQWMS